MNPLLLLFLAASASAGLAFWQQRSINSVQAATARLSGQMLQTRSALESEQTALASARNRLKQLEAEFESAKQERAALGATRASGLPTPRQEGWWPANRPYFYLAKKYLTQVRFEGRPLTPDAEPGGDVKAPVVPHENIWMNYQPFGERELNPHLAVLLGMSDEEVVRVNDSYADFVGGLRGVEAAHVQRVEPPQPAGDGDHVVVARLPAIDDETQPLLERWGQALDQTLGAVRAEILRDHAERYFEEELDQLGSEQREFLREGDNLSVRFGDTSGNWHFKGTTFHLPTQSAKGQDWEYGHIFGPGAPCELK